VLFGGINGGGQRSYPLAVWPLPALSQNGQNRRVEGGQIRGEQLQ
jgi:hypothetical protein